MLFTVAQMKIIKRVVFVILGVILAIYVLLKMIESSILDAEWEEAERLVENKLKQNFQDHPDAFQNLYLIVQDFPNIQDLRFFASGDINFEINHCKAPRNNHDFCRALEIIDTTAHNFVIRGDDTLEVLIDGELIETTSWSINFLAKPQHPNFVQLLKYLGTDTSAFFKLKELLIKSGSDVGENSFGFNKTDSLVAFGVTGEFGISQAYMIPMHKNLSLKHYNKLGEKYYYGIVPNFPVYIN